MIVIGNDITHPSAIDYPSKKILHILIVDHFLRNVSCDLRSYPYESYVLHNQEHIDDLC